MDSDDTPGSAQKRAAAKDGAKPRLRLPLRDLDDVKAEMARLYRQGKSGQRDVTEVSKLANVLALLARLIEGSTFEARLEALEAQRESEEAQIIDITPRLVASNEEPNGKHSD